MSLVVTSSSQAEFDTSGKKQFGLENPASYQNHLRSPLIIDANSEVALVSIKCNRDDDTVSIEGDLLYVYWGVEKPNNEADESRVPRMMDDINTPLLIRLVDGVYTKDQFTVHLKERLDAVVLLAYREVKEILVTETTLGFKIQFDQHGDGSGFTDKPSASEFGAYIDENTQRAVDDATKYPDVSQHTDNFTAVTSLTNVNITANNAGATGTRCDAIGHAHPLSLVNGKCVIYFNGSSVADGEDGYTIGLIRSQGKEINGTKVDFGDIGGFGQRRPQYDDSVNIPAAYRTGAGGGPPFLWDVAFNWEAGKDGQVVHLVNNDNDEVTESYMDTVTLANTPTNADLEAKVYDRVEFHTDGENIKVYLGLTGKATLLTLVDGSNTAYGSRVKPMGITCNQLYPKIHIANTTTAPYGDVSLRTYNGHSALSYYDENYWGYNFKRADDRFWTVWKQVSRRIEESGIYGDGTTDDGGPLYVYKTQLASNAGIDYRWSLLLGNFEDQPVFGYFTDQDQIFEQTPDKLQTLLGMPYLLLETRDGTVTNGGATVSFESTALSDFPLSSSMFVRLKNQALNSYNANKGSISNIIYGCPRFDSRGNSTGTLWYEPEERVYVKFNNVDKFVLNSIDIDIVDVNEKVIPNLVGNTVIILHVKKNSDMDF